MLLRLFETLPYAACAAIVLQKLCMWRAEGWNETDVPNETWNVSEDVWEDVNESVEPESIDGNLSDWSLVFDGAAGASAEFCILQCALFWQLMREPCKVQTQVLLRTENVSDATLNTSSSGHAQVWCQGASLIFLDTVDGAVHWQMVRQLP